MKALFPISLGTQRFSSERMLKALDQVSNDFGEIVFLIADKIQIYNRVMRSIHGSATSATWPQGLLTKSEFGLEETLKERRRWLRQIIEKISVKNSALKFKIIGLDSIADSLALAILRRVRILWCVDRTFRDDISETAKLFLLNYVSAYEGGGDDVALYLSESYLLEEIALSIRIKVYEKVYDEYYLGNSIKAAVRLFSGSYAISPWELAGMPEANPDVVFRYFDFDDVTGKLMQMQ